ncbi:ABC transporter ATP-binding protein [Nocardia beijingensis]|uniref:ABC transporter ATP-binding protein n=1 Tax=Nocardia beijingensis TaxID=95162 RepID=UPI0033EA3C93
MTQRNHRDRVRYRDLIALLSEHKGGIAVGGLFLLAGTGVGIVQPLVTMKIIEAVSDHRTIAGLVTLLICVFVAQAVFDALGNFFVSRTGERVVLGLRTRLIHRLLRIRMPVLNQLRIGDLTARLGTDTSLLREDVVTSVVQFGISMVSVAAALTVMIWLSPFMTVVALMTTVAAGILVTGALAGIRTASESVQASVGDLTADTQRALSSLRTVRASLAEDREFSRLTVQAAQAFDSGVHAARLESIIRSATLSAVNGSFLALLLVGGIRVAGGQMEVSELVGILLYSTFLATPVSGSIALLGSMQRGMGAFQRVAEALGVDIEMDNSACSNNLGNSDRRNDASQPHGAGQNRPATVEVRHLTFSYESSRRILDDVSFTVPPGEQIALVGQSGSGKSTLLALIERFYEPDSGTILVDEVDAFSTNLRSYRQRIALVEQGAPILHGSVRENLTYANPYATEQDVVRAVELAGFGDVLERLDRGFDTQVGEQGQSLSGGERQRLAIARALLTEPDLLLLDEPTSDLDPISEASIALTLEKLRGQCTVIVAAHRYSTIRAADCIVVVNDGRVEAIGTHEELLTSSAYYRELAKDTITAS